MVNLKIPGSCFCGFNLKSMSKQKTCPSFNHTLQSTLKVKPTIDNFRPFSCLDQINKFQDISIDLKDNTDVLLSLESLESHFCSAKIKNHCKEFKRKKHAKNIASSEYKNLLMKMSLFENRESSTNKKPPVNRNLSENFGIKKKKEKTHRYSVSDHISQMSTWQNTLISEFGMLPTLPCIPYFSVLDDSDKSSNVSYNESIISIHDSHTEPFNDNMSHLTFPDMNFLNIRRRMSSLNNSEFRKMMALMSNSSKRFKTINSPQHIDTKSSKAIISSKYSNIESFKHITSKGRFKFKFPKIRFSQKYNQNNFSKIIIPTKHNKESSKIKVLSNFPDIFHRKENIDLFKDTNIFHEFKAAHLNLEDHANIEKPSLAIPRYVINESYKYQKEMQSDKNIPLETNTPEHTESPQQPVCFCTCTCLCRACCGFSETRRILRRRPSSIVFVEIAASRKTEKYSDTMDFGEDFDDKTTTAISKTCISNDSSSIENQIKSTPLSLSLIDHNNSKPDSNNKCDDVDNSKSKLELNNNDNDYSKVISNNSH
ncbi:hypothetical protein PCANB_000749 [Pneumocystis canis]|nr:hypothetical protein PCANB_000749 [Pneumocystis canis]